MPLVCSRPVSQHPCWPPKLDIDVLVDATINIFEGMRGWGGEDGTVASRVETSRGCELESDMAFDMALDMMHLQDIHLKVELVSSKDEVRDMEQTFDSQPLTKAQMSATSTLSPLPPQQHLGSQPVNPKRNGHSNNHPNSDYHSAFPPLVLPDIASLPHPSFPGDNNTTTETQPPDT